MSRTRMTTLAFIISELFPLDGFRCNFVSALLLKYPLVYYNDTLQIRRTGPDDVVTHTGITALACILSELYSLDCLSCNALYFEYRQDYFLYGSVLEVVTMCRVNKIWRLSFSYFL